MNKQFVIICPFCHTQHLKEHIRGCNVKHRCHHPTPSVLCMQHYVLGIRNSEHFGNTAHLKRHLHTIPTPIPNALWDQKECLY